MLALIFRRLLQAIPVLFIVLTLTFILMRNAPGSPFSGERAMPPEIMAQWEKKYKLNGTIWQQYGDYIHDVVRGDLGLSTQYRGRNVNQILAQTLPVSMVLGTLAYSLALVIGITIGGMAAIRHNGPGDRSLMLLALLGISVPNFVTASLLVIFFAIQLQILPVAGWGSPDQIVLPALCLSLPFISSIARLTRNSLLDVLKLDFIRTARAKGLSENAVLFVHALKVAILPIVGYSGPAAAGVLTGSVVVETFFGIPGIGPFFVNSVLNRDPFMTCGVVLIFSLFLLIFNLIADILYSVLDRRVRLA
ncbi:MAG TPA: ABC transporter permease subunit [Candidatus Methylacidiphilales bacterium]|nr:ABC transporter permease subunit [Candidatus Methylacidiphilales bacterium]